MKVGLLGTGRMGAAIARRLIDCGHSLIVWNRSVGKAAALVEHGATLASSPADLAANAQIIISILTDAAAIEATFAGPEGVFAADIAGRIIIEMSTVGPQTQIDLAERLAARGAALVECPVGGTVGPARDGKLLGLVGGADGDVARVRPIIEQMCRRVEHVGPIGSGARMKLAVNLPLMVYWQALGEAIALAKPIGLDPVRLMDILADTSGAPTAIKLRGPLVAAVLKGAAAGATLFDIDSIRKDLRTMLAEGEHLGYDLLTTRAAMQAFDAAASAGLGGHDSTELAAWWVANARQAS